MDSSDYKKEILSQMPQNLQKLFADVEFGTLQEIRFRAEMPIMLYRERGMYYIQNDGIFTTRREMAYRISRENLKRLFCSFCENSVYAHQQEICDGFLTLRGGHRVGISGRAVLEQKSIRNITELSGLNLRIAKAYPHCADQIAEALQKENGSIYNGVLLAPPQCGKTTMLRDLARAFSARHKVTVVDERSEIAAMRDGVAQFELGEQTDVLDRFPKEIGIRMAVRALSPDVIITDELGTQEDIAAVKESLNAGCSIVTSMHAERVQDLLGERKTLFSLFDRAVLLKRMNGIPTVTSVVPIKKAEEDSSCCLL